MRLSRQQRKKLQLALVDAFPTKSLLEQMLSFGLNKNLNAIALGGDLQETVFKLIQVAEAQGWLLELVHGAYQSNPGNPKLQTIAQELLMGSVTIPSTQQQKNRRDLLDAVKFEINARLEQSLHNAVLIELGKELQPERVKRPWDVEVLIFCFSGGAKSLIQHFILRLILYCNGYIPWNYARFLDYCTDRLFLQRVGGRYRFIHKMLQEHFANMEFK